MSPGTKSRLRLALERQLPHLGLNQQLRLGFGLVALTTAVSGALSVSGFQRVARHAEAASAVLVREMETGGAANLAPGWARTGLPSRHEAPRDAYSQLPAGARLGAGPGEKPDEKPREERGASPEELLARLRAVSANARRSESLAMGFALAAGLFAIAAAAGLILRIKTPLKAIGAALRLPEGSAGNGAGDGYAPAQPNELGPVEMVDLGAVVEAAQAFQSEALEARTRLADAEVKGAQLAQTNDDLEGFVRSVSHDLKAPLASVTGFLAMARETLEEGDHRGAIPILERAEQASLRADILVRELLELAKIGRSGEPEAVLISRAIADVLNEYEVEVQRARLNVEVEPQLGVAFVDPRSLRQVLGNVIGNALKYGSSAPAPSLHISSKQTERGLQVRIADNGPGIPIDARGRAFDPFERLTDHGEGTGLGLSLVERAMANAGGTVTVEDTLGGGATFVLHFPSPSEWGVVDPTILMDREDARGETTACEYGD